MPIQFDLSLEPSDTSTPEARLIAAYPQLFAREFGPWLADNRHIWREFRRQADAVWDRGYRHYSARTIVHFLRHHTALAEVGGGSWKINNNYSPDLARLYSLIHHERDGFFEFRTMHNSDKRAA